MGLAFPLGNHFSPGRDIQFPKYTLEGLFDSITTDVDVDGDFSIAESLGD
jgi:hypothetical protein